MRRAAPTARRSDPPDIAPPQAGQPDQGEGGGDAGEREQRQEGQARSRQLGHALEWREVLEPAWEAEDRPEESTDDAGRKDRPRHADPTRYQPVEGDGEPDHDPHGRRGAE